jgi:hypothetical protein
MAKKEKEKSKLEVVKDNNEINNEEKKKGPSPEEVAKYKEEFETAMKNFTEMRWEISEPGDFSANKAGMFLLDFLEKYVLWTKTGWMGVIKMKEELDNALKDDNKDKGLSLDYQALEFCGYMLTNPGGVGLDVAIEFEKIADEYSLIMTTVGKKIEDARKTLKDVKYLQEKWAAGEQGFFLADLEPKDEPKDEEKDDNSSETPTEEQK